MSLDEYASRPLASAAIPELDDDAGNAEILGPAISLAPERGIGRSRAHGRAAAEHRTHDNGHAVQESRTGGRLGVEIEVAGQRGRDALEVGGRELGALTRRVDGCVRSNARVVSAARGQQDQGGSSSRLFFHHASAE